MVNLMTSAMVNVGDGTMWFMHIGNDPREKVTAALYGTLVLCLNKMITDNTYSAVISLPTSIPQTALEHQAKYLKEKYPTIRSELSGHNVTIRLTPTADPPTKLFVLDSVDRMNAFIAKRWFGFTMEIDKSAFGRVIQEL